MYNRLLFFWLLFFITPFSYCQYYESGQDPAFIKWQQINSEKFQIIFPSGFEKEAQRLANSLEMVYLYATQTLKSDPKKISVILHNYSSLSNAFVAWAPKRAEFYTIPPQDNYPQDWLSQLAIHEYRHVVQISKLNQGITKIISILLGEQGTAAVLGLFVPLWFLEGDAVAAETALSYTGRGRLPAFEMLLRTQVLGTKIYSYEKSYFGSYKDFVPDYYKMGYYLVAYGRSKYGYKLWDNTIDYTARHPYFPTPFSKGIKKTSTLSKWGFYKSAFNSLDSLWQLQKKQLTYSRYTKINTGNKHVYTNYRYPQLLSDSNCIVLKEGLGNIDEFVLLNDKGEERKLFTPGYISPVWLSATNDLIVWPEYGFDKRWENRLYSDIIIYDINSQKRKRLTRKRYLFSPALSKDGSKIVAVEVEFGNHYSLVVLDSKNGSLLERITSPDNLFLLTPTWSEDGSRIAYCSLSDSGKAINIYYTEEKRHELILHSGAVEITQPVQAGNNVYFHGTWSGIDNIYALDLTTRKTYQVTSSVYGAFDPCISKDGKTLYYSDYSPLGYDIVRSEINSDNWILLDSIKNTSIQLYQSLNKDEKGVIQFDTLTQITHSIRPYRKFTHLLNFHSWAPVYIDIDNTRLSPGATLLSQNKLSTMTVALGYRFNYDEGTSRFNTNISYKAVYPVLNLEWSTEQRRSAIIDTTGKREYSWKENNVSFGIAQTLNFTRGKYRRGVNIGTGFSLKDIIDVQDAPQNFYTGRLTTLKSYITAFRYLKTSKRDVRAKWGQSFEFYYYTGLKSNVNIRELYAVEAGFNFPGIIRHQSLRLTFAYQKQSSGVLNFSSPLPGIRGYTNVLNANEFRKFSVDYKFPILYPDLRLGPFLYLQRVKLNLFYDYGYGTYSLLSTDFQSTGVELTSDLNLCNFIAPLDLGFRINYLIPSGLINTQILLSAGLP